MANKPQKNCAVNLMETAISKVSAGINCVAVVDFYLMGMQCNSAALQRCTVHSTGTCKERNKGKISTALFEKLKFVKAMKI